MHCDDAIVLAKSTTPHSAEFLHVSTNPQQQAHVHAKRPDVCPGLAADPEDSKVSVIVKL